MWSPVVSRDSRLGMQGDSLRVAESWSELGVHVMASGLGTTQDELLAFAEEGSPDPADFSRHLFRVVNAMLHSAGVKVDPPPLVDHDEAAPVDDE